MKLQRGALPGRRAAANDNFRVKRYIAKYTINPAITTAWRTRWAAIEVGKLADLVLWRPAFLRRQTEPDPQGRHDRRRRWATQRLHPDPQPVHYRPMFGSLRAAMTATLGDLCVARRWRQYRPAVAAAWKRLVAVRAAAAAKKPTDMVTTLPDIERRSANLSGRADGELLW